MKALLLAIFFIPTVLMAQFDYEAWKARTEDSLLRLVKPVLTVNIGNNGYESDIPQRAALSFPGHIKLSFGLNYVQPLNNYWFLDINASYNQIGVNSYSSAKHFEGTMMGGDANITYNFGLKHRVRPYIGIGIGAAQYYSAKDSLNANGQAYYHWSDGSTRDMPESYQNYFIANEIQYDWNYETQITKGVKVYVPISAGARMNITPKLISSLNYTYQFTNNAIDGVTGGRFDAIHKVTVGVGYKFGVTRPEMPIEDSIIINVLAIDSVTKQPLADVKVTLYKLLPDGTKEKIDSSVTNSNGIAPLYYPENLDLYEVKFEKETFYTKTLALPEHSRNKKAYDNLNPTVTAELGTTWKDIPVSGNVIDKFTEKPLEGVLVQLFEYIGGQYVVIDSTYTNKNGDFDFVLDHEGDYKILLDKEQYKEKEFIIPDPASDEWDIFMDGINPFTMEPEAKKGNVFRVDNIYFAFAKANALDESLPILDNIAKFLLENPTVRIELGAHTDCVGKDAANMKLSIARAKFCVDYLASKGIDISRLESKGYGETKILNGCFTEGQCSTEENQVNRRVEVKVL